MNIEERPEYRAGHLKKLCNATRNGKTLFGYQVQWDFDSFEGSTMNLFEENGRVTIHPD